VSFFFDLIQNSVYAAPFIGAMLVCLFLSIIGVVFFLKKESLLGETLSHSAYPGVMIGALFKDSYGSLFVSGCLSVTIAYFLVHWLINRKKIDQDTSLLFVLALFFSIGITLASRVQFTNPTAYQGVQMYLYGQPALLTTEMSYFYSIFTIFLLIGISLFFRPLQMILFQPTFARLKAAPVTTINIIVSFFYIGAIVFGIRSVGIVLISGMLIAPPVAARQWTNKLSKMFILSAIFGLLSAFTGCTTAFHMTIFGKTLPMGPMIVFYAVNFALLSLLISPKRGYLTRIYRIYSFRNRSIIENMFKCILKQPNLSFKELQKAISGPAFLNKLRIYLLQKKDFILSQKGKLSLTVKGYTKANKIVRLHRLWELYLAQQMGIDKSLVHASAEEMEHALTSELEAKLDHELDSPKEDPHKQPIPRIPYV
jgi:manganese/zinc/iron transport system permease protein